MTPEEEIELYSGGKEDWDTIRWNILKELKHKADKFKSQNKLHMKTQLSVKMPMMDLLLLDGLWVDVLSTIHVMEIYASPETDYEFSVYT